MVIPAFGGLRGDSCMWRQYVVIPTYGDFAVPLFFFVTPVIWFNDALGSRAILSTLNPLSHLIDVIRKPMLGDIPNPTNYCFVLLTILFIWILGIKLFTKFRNRITLWI